jgi:hypothetical protein
VFSFEKSALFSSFLSQRNNWLNFSNLNNKIVLISVKLKKNNCFNFSYDEFSIWAADKCTPLVREITFENAEELTEEGLPFLILVINLILL